MTGPKVARNSLTGAQINAATLGTVPNASHASSADRASSANVAFNAAALGGSPSSSFQSRVTGSCGANSPIEHVNGDGSVACGHVQFFSGRTVEPIGGSDTFLTIPGAAHVVVGQCSSSQAQSTILNDALGTTDLWLNGDSQFAGVNWFSDPSPVGTPANGTTWHIGTGSGAGAKIVTVTVSYTATGSNCIFQGTAEVITS